LTLAASAFLAGARSFKGHGRIDRRSIETRSRIPPRVDFPGAKQIGRIRRARSIKCVVTAETICFITSLPRLRANAPALLNLARSHGSIENGLQRVRDVSMGEDACTVTRGSAPQALAALRNAVLSLLRQSDQRRPRLTPLRRPPRRSAGTARETSDGILESPAAKDSLRGSLP